MSLYRITDYDPKNTYRHGAKLDATKVVWARHMHYAEGYGIRDLARRLAVAPSTMHDAITGSTWSNVHPNVFHWNDIKNRIPSHRGCRCAQCKSKREKLGMGSHVI